MNADIIADFQDHLAAVGIHLIDPIAPTAGHFRRARLVGEKSRPGSFSYKLFMDHPAGATYSAWKLNIAGNWTQRSGNTLTSDELARARRENEENRQRREVEMVRVKAAAAEEARRIWDAGKPAPANHPYLTRKRVKRSADWTGRPVDRPRLWPGRCDPHGSVPQRHQQDVSDEWFCEGKLRIH